MYLWQCENKSEPYLRWPQMVIVYIYILLKFMDFCFPHWYLQIAFLCAFIRLVSLHLSFVPHWFKQLYEKVFWRHKFYFFNNKNDCYIYIQRTFKLLYNFLSQKGWTIFYLNTWSKSYANSYMMKSICVHHFSTACDSSGEGSSDHPKN